MRCLISLVNDNHVNNYLKDTLAFVYYGSTVNNRPKSQNHKEKALNNQRLSLGLYWSPTESLVNAKYFDKKKEQIKQGGWQANLGPHYPFSLAYLTWLNMMKIH